MSDMTDEPRTTACPMPDDVCADCGYRCCEPSDDRTESTKEVTAFEHEFSNHVGLARRILAAVPDTYTEAQLDDIGRRARHWVMDAYREWSHTNEHQ